MATHSMTGPAAAAGAGSAFFRKNGYLRTPRFVQWMATLRCTMDCPHCLAADDGAPDMPLRHVERLLDQVREMGVGEFLITGGEPVCRPDLPAVIDALRERGQRWTLNTAASPGPRLRAAMERHPPAFVAVSLDGPEPVHDRFRGRTGAHREALEAIRFYRGVVDGDVVAGTTVTRANYRSLSATFAEVVASGATAWGLHLLVPEGRARRNRSLFLSRRQLRGLLDFCAARRNHFPVGMADEIGYLGEEEPLVRDAPFLCGAGRTQCVVLPGGQVVPCTTLDRSASAGSVLKRPLAEIWAEGFEALRHWQPEGACRSCEYAPACGGGCWLQRRRGRGCFKSVWRAPRLVGSAAGLAVCLGLGPALGGEPPPEPAPGRPSSIVPKPVTREEYEDLRRRALKRRMEDCIVEWYCRRQLDPRGRRSDEVLRRAKGIVGKDPAVGYFLEYAGRRRGRGLAARCAAVRAGLETKQVSLSLAALMWRDLAEACLDGPAPAERPGRDRERLRETLAALDSRASEWRRRFFEEKLQAFLLGRMNPWAMHFKSLRIGLPASNGVSVKLEKEWQEAFSRAHPFAESMKLTVRCNPEAGLVLLRAGKEEKTGGEIKLRVFDVIKTPADGKEKEIEIDAPGNRRDFDVRLPAGGELTYADVLRLAYEQGRGRFDAEAARVAGKGDVSLLHPVLLPALRVAAGQKPRPLSRAEQRKLRAAVADLAAEQWEKREAAGKAITGLGSAAVPALQEAARSRDPEVAGRAKTLLGELDPATNPKMIKARRMLINLWLF